MNFVIYLCIASFFTLSYAGKVPFFKPCAITDKPCIISSAQAAVPIIAAGVPDLGVLPTDPLVIKEATSQTKDLKIVFKDFSIAGLGKCVVADVDRLPNQINLVLECPITAAGQYTAEGKIVGINISGDGPFEIKTEKARLAMRVKTPYVEGKDGKMHIDVTSYEHDYEALEKVDIFLGNLFNGDEKQADPLLKILNASGKELIKTIGKPIVDEIIARAIATVKKLVIEVPAEDFELA